MTTMSMSATRLPILHQQQQLQACHLKKVVRFFQEKIGRHPSVAAPRDINPSDATACHIVKQVIVEFNAL